MICLLVGGPDRIIAIDGVDYRFEDHPQCGPTPLTKRGAVRTLGPRHPFWAAVTQWCAGGKLIVDGRCAWAPEPDPLEGMVCIGGRNWVAIDSARGRAFLAAREARA